MHRLPVALSLGVRAIDLYASFQSDGFPNPKFDSSTRLSGSRYAFLVYMECFSRRRNVNSNAPETLTTLVNLTIAARECHQQSTLTRTTSFLNCVQLILDSSPNFDSPNRSSLPPTATPFKPAQKVKPSSDDQMNHPASTNTTNTFLPQPPESTTKLPPSASFIPASGSPTPAETTLNIHPNTAPKHLATTLQNPTQPSPSISSLFESNSSQNHADLLPKNKARVTHQLA